MHSPRPARTCRRGHRKRHALAPLGQARDDGQARLSVELYLARHGETEWSLSGQHTGRTDLPLTARGEENAAALRPRLAGLAFDAVYSSPLIRARRTAELAGFPDPRLTPLLREVDYGDYEGLTSKEIRESRPGWDVYRDGCPGGESPAQIYARAREFVSLATGGAGRVLAFAHGHILRAIAVAWINVDIMVAAGFELDVATLSVMGENGHGRVIALWNAP